MKEVFPNYYNKFKCIANKCKHNCCIGWEIDIDEDTIDLYDCLDNDFGQRIRENIEGEEPHFIMKEDGRCPFLNDSGLCDIIIEYGDGAICDICYLHPRFRNFYDDFIETGLGLCCEEAVRVILTEEEKFSIELPDDAKNSNFFIERAEVINILQDRSVTFCERFNTVAEKYNLNFNIDAGKICDLFLSLERLDKAWENEIEKIKDGKSEKIFASDEFQIMLEQLACYFVFRHFHNGVGFMLLSCLVLGSIFSDCKSLEEMLEAVRMYSSEIEYCEENIQNINEFIVKNASSN